MKIFSEMNFKTPQAAFASGLRLLFAPVILVVLVAIFINVAAPKNAAPEKLERGNGIYINSGAESDVFEHVPAGYQRSDKCESNEFFIDSINGCVIGIDVDTQISIGLIVHREFINEVDGKMFYRLLVSSPDGSLLKKG